MNLPGLLTSETRRYLFPKTLSGDVTVSPIVELDDATHLIGVSLGSSVQIVVAFLRAQDQLDGDTDLLNQLAHSWTVFRKGHRLCPGARIIKFWRADATHETFEPSKWPLPSPKLVWHLERALVKAIELYTSHSVGTAQYFYLPQSRSLERWYARLERQFCRSGSCQPEFRVIAKPEETDGGFHGYERIHIQEAVADTSRRGGGSAKCQPIQADQDYL